MFSLNHMERLLLVEIVSETDTNHRGREPEEDNPEPKSRTPSCVYLLQWRNQCLELQREIHQVCCEYIEDASSERQCQDDPTPANSASQTGPRAHDQHCSSGSTAEYC